MINFIKKIKYNVRQNILHNTEAAKPYFTVLGLILIISYFGFYFFNSQIAEPDGYENIFLRTIICICGCILIAYRYMFQYIISIFPYIFYLILLFSFPFFFTYMLFKNQYSNTWQVNELVGLVLLSFFVDWKSFIGLSLIGIGLAFLCVYVEGFSINTYDITKVFGSYSAPVIYFLIFSQKRQQIQNEMNNYNEKITELNNSLEEKVKLRTLELEEALAFKTEILNNISHEIRTPVHGFTAISEGLFLHWHSLSEQKKISFASQVATSARRLGTLIDNLLDLSKFVANKMELNYQRIDLNELIDHIIEEGKSLYSFSKELNIIFNRANDADTIADKEKIGQVVRNLLTNAFKFSPNNGLLKLSLENIIVEDKPFLHFKIIDEGIGVPEEELEKIFESFIQSSRTRKNGGTGLGLSICKQIIEAHDGKIWATNNQQVGAAFHFILPVK